MKKIGRILCYVFAVFWGIITIFPLYISILSSLKDNVGITLGMFKLPEKFLWSNYVDAFISANIGKAVLNSIFLSFTTTIFVILLGMLAAYILSRKEFKFRNIIYSLFIVGVMVPVHSTIIPISTFATSINGRDTYWFLIIIYIGFNLAQSVFLFTGYFNGIDRELDQAAIIDGCNDIQLFRHILFPIATPMIATVSILTFIFAYGELIFSIILLSDEAKFPTSRAMLTFSGGYIQELGPIFASIIICVCPMVIFYILFHEKVQSGMLAGSVKG